MPDNNTQQPQYIYVQQPGYDIYEEEEFNVLELFSSIWKRKWFVFIITFLFGMVGLVYAFYLPFIYKAECRVLPQTSGGTSSRLSSLASQYGGLASMMGISIPTRATTGGTMIEVMRGNTIVDIITDRFGLMEQYEAEYRLRVRQTILKNLDAQEDSASGIITVSYLDKDPQKAADIANAFVEETQKKLLEMFVLAAQQTRAFYENQLIQAQQELTEAENAMMKYQQSSGVVALEEQSKVLINSIASLRTQIAAKNVEISSLKSYAKADNPTLKMAISELEGLQAELRRLEEEQKHSDSGRSNHKSSRDVLPSVGEIPELGLEYERYLRTLKIAGAKYQLMLQQYESAKLDEMNDVPSSVIVDPALPPDYKYKPSRAKITLAWAFAGWFLSAMWVGFPNFKKQISEIKNKRSNDDDDYDDD